MNKKKAVALKYSAGLPAPFVIAKGKAALAEKLVEIAETHGVEVLSEPQLSEALVEIEVGVVDGVDIFLSDLREGTEAGE